MNIKAGSYFFLRFETVIMVHAKVNLSTFFTVLLCLFAAIIPMDASRARAGDHARHYDVALEIRHEQGRDVLLIKVSPLHGYHLNTEYPWKVTVHKAAGLVLEKYEYRRAEARVMTEDEVVFGIPYRAEKKAELKASLKLAVCRQEQCIFDEVHLSWPEAPDR